MVCLTLPFPPSLSLIVYTSQSKVNSVTNRRALLLICLRRRIISAAAIDYMIRGVFMPKHTAFNQKSLVTPLFRVSNRFQLVVQVGTFGSLFLMMFETYPFRVGLMGMLTSQYLTVYVINVLYFITTACIYGYRVVSGNFPFQNHG